MPVKTCFCGQFRYICAYGKQNPIGSRKPLKMVLLVSRCSIAATGNGARTGGSLAFNFLPP